MDGRNEAGLKQKNTCHGVLSYENLAAIPLVQGGEKPEGSSLQRLLKET